MTRKLLLACFLGISSVSGFAQLSGNVNVEGEYEPIVIETERINIFPEGYKFELPSTNLDYEFNGIVTDFRPGLLTMGVTGRRTSWAGPKRRGYVDLRAGSYLNTRLHAGYYILSDSVNTLLADLKFQSSTLFRTKGIPSYYTPMARKRLYDGTLTLDYSRLIGNEGLLSAKAAYRLGYFNYYGTTVNKYSLPAGQNSIDIPTQTLNQVEASVGYASSPSIIKGWHAEAAVRYTAYRRLYSPVFPVINTMSSQGDRETELTVGGGYAFSTSENSAFALDAKGDFLFLSGKSPAALDIPAYKRNNYGIISLYPSYRYLNSPLKVKAGLDMAFSYDAMGSAPDKKFGVFHIAPDIELDYRSEAGIGLTLSATGGVIPSTLMLREEFDRYMMPWVLSTQPVYTPVDARLGLNFGPFAGFDASLYFRYAVAKNVPVGGWYQVYLGSYFDTFPTQDISLFTDPGAQSADLHGLSLGLNLRYNYGNRVKLSFEGSYTPQKGNHGIFNGFDRPRWILRAGAEVLPIQKLSIRLGYDYRGVRNCFAWTQNADEMALTAYRLPDINDFNARITYSILDNFDIYCQGDNLLNKKTDLLPGLRSEGIVISGGFYVEF